MQCNSQAVPSGVIRSALFSIAMKVTTYSKEHEHEVIFGVVILIVTSLVALLILYTKLYYM